MNKPIIDKLGIKAHLESFVANAPPGFEKDLDALNPIRKKRLVGNFDYLHLFIENQSQFHSKFPLFKKHLKPGGMLWLSWPKGGKNTDLSLTKIIEMGYEYGLVESKVVSIDNDWSAIKFTFPKAGKIYNNSYGKLR